jgi:hypothetical protein
MSDAPVVETHFVLSGGDEWGGLGEAGTPPGANAVFTVTGKMHPLAAARERRARGLGAVAHSAAQIPPNPAGQSKQKLLGFDWSHSCEQGLVNRLQRFAILLGSRLVAAHLLWRGLYPAARI